MEPVRGESCPPRDNGEVRSHPGTRKSHALIIKASIIYNSNNAEMKMDTPGVDTALQNVVGPTSLTDLRFGWGSWSMSRRTRGR